MSVNRETGRALISGAPDEGEMRFCPLLSGRSFYHPRFEYQAYQCFSNCAWRVGKQCAIVMLAGAFQGFVTKGDEA